MFKNKTTMTSSRSSSSLSTVEDTTTIDSSGGYTSDEAPKDEKSTVRRSNRKRKPIETLNITSESLEQEKPKKLKQEKSAEEYFVNGFKKIKSYTGDMHKLFDKLLDALRQMACEYDDMCKNSTGLEPGMQHERYTDYLQAFDLKMQDIYTLRVGSAEYTNSVLPEFLVTSQRTICNLIAENRALRAQLHENTMNMADQDLQICTLQENLAAKDAEIMRLKNNQANNVDIFSADFMLELEQVTLAQQDTTVETQLLEENQRLHKELKDVQATLNSLRARMAKTNEAAKLVFPKILDALQPAIMYFTNITDPNSTVRYASSDQIEIKRQMLEVQSWVQRALDSIQALQQKRSAAANQAAVFTPQYQDSTANVQHSSAQSNPVNPDLTPGLNF